MNQGKRPLHREVLLFTFLACGLVLAVTGFLLFTHHIGETRTRLDESVKSTAGIVAHNAGAALAFRDEKAASEILSSLRLYPLVVAAALYDLEGQRFVAYGDSMAERRGKKDVAEGDESLVVEVTHEGERFGSLVVRSDARAVMRRTILTWGGVFLLALMLAGGLAFWLAGRFQKVIAEPLVSLSRTAQDVSDRADYSLRAEPRGSPEVVALAKAFNTMLGEIGRRGEIVDRQVVSLNAEIRRRHEAEEVLRQNTREMLRISHRAGMAEVATGVLHNIGNALNSINVSAELLADSLGLRVHSSVARLQEFFRNPPPKAAAVYAAHPDGDGLRQAASGATEAAAGAIAETKAELDSLRVGVGHLKDIVARQQSLAKADRQVSLFDLGHAVQQALALDHTLGRSASQGLRVETIRLGDPLPQVCSDQGAIEQILINLLANAREAISQAAPPEPTIVIELGPPSTTHLPVAVRDNGVGISPDKLVSIFTYGFTTKPGGHGFGLHNAANLARLLGGSLRVHSDGPGRGAVFTLEVLLSPTGAKS